MIKALRDRLHSQRGVSLVEMLVAITVVSITLAALASGLITAMHATHGQRLRTVATRVMSQEFEQLRAAGYDTLKASLTAGTSDSTQTLTQDGRAYTLRTVLQESDADGNAATDLDKVIDIELTATWNDLSNVRTAASTTTIAPEQTQTASGGGGPATSIGDVSFSPSIAMVDKVYWKTTQNVTVVVPVVGYAAGTLVTLKWTDDVGTHTRSTTFTFGASVEFLISAGDIRAEIPSAASSRDVPFTITAGTNTKGASLPVQRQPSTPLALSGATITPGTIALTNAHKTKGCTANGACVNSQPVTFTITVDGFNNSQNSDSVKVRYILASGNQEEVALVRQGTGSPSTGVGTSTWSATVATGTVKFAHPTTGVANRTFTFMATRFTDIPATVVQLDKQHPVQAPYRP